MITSLLTQLERDVYVGAVQLVVYQLAKCNILRCDYVLELLGTNDLRQSAVCVGGYSCCKGSV
jgi:hypothetical protein